VILSDRTLREQLANGRIIIEPFDESCVQPSSIDVKLSNHFRVFRNHTAGVIDVVNEMYKDFPLALLLVVVATYLILLVLVLLPGFGVGIGGARRWFAAGPTRSGPATSSGPPSSSRWRRSAFSSARACCSACTRNCTPCWSIFTGRTRRRSLRRGEKNNRCHTFLMACLWRLPAIFWSAAAGRQGRLRPSRRRRPERMCWWWKA